MKSIMEQNKQEDKSKIGTKTNQSLNNDLNRSQFELTILSFESINFKYEEC
jgi:hypothetical protein